MKTIPTKLIYVMGPAYTGSTLLGLLLEQHNKVFNLGEVINLEHDYTPETACSCGEKLGDCPFWSKAAEQLNAQDDQYSLKTQSRRHDIDARGGMHKLKLVFGGSARRVFRDQDIDLYIKRNLHLFQTIQELTHSEYLVDLSKNPERLELLLESEELECYVLEVRRNEEDVYASTLKRPKRTRAKYGFKKWREAIWLNLRAKHQQRIIKKVAPSHHFILSFDQLMAHPKEELSKIYNWLGLELNQDQIKAEIDLRDHHVYVGNRWLFNRQDPMVEINAKRSETSLSTSARLIFRTVRTLVGPKYV